jgi:hypothetical protein
MRRSPALTAAAVLVVAAGAVALQQINGSEPGLVAAPSASRAADTPAPIPPEHMPPPFGDRGIRLPDPGAPPASETAAFCDESNWTRLSESELRPSIDGEGVFRVDATAWDRALAGSRAGLASWMSQCQRDGGPIVIVAHVTGERLATYDPGSGLRPAP